MQGTGRNPRENQHYKSPQFRTFSHSWELFPMEEGDEEIIGDIVDNFRKWSLPSIQDLTGSTDDGQYISTYRAPLMWEIKHLLQDDGGKVSDETPWGNFGISVITDVNVNYTGAGLYAATEKGPAFVNLTVNFTEVRLRNRESVPAATVLKKAD